MVIESHSLLSNQHTCKSSSENKDNLHDETQLIEAFYFMFEGEVANSPLTEIGIERLHETYSEELSEVDQSLAGPETFDAVRESIEATTSDQNSTVANGGGQLVEPRTLGLGPIAMINDDRNVKLAKSSGPAPTAGSFTLDGEVDGSRVHPHDRALGRVSISVPELKHAILRSGGESDALEVQKATKIAQSPDVIREIGSSTIVKNRDVYNLHGRHEDLTILSTSPKTHAQNVTHSQQKEADQVFKHSEPVQQDKSPDASKMLSVVEKLASPIQQQTLAAQGNEISRRSAKVMRSDTNDTIQGIVKGQSQAHDTQPVTALGSTANAGPAFLDWSSQNQDILKFGEVGHINPIHELSNRTPVHSSTIQSANQNTAKGIAQQLIASVLSDGLGRSEISLNPKELGRLKLQISTTDTSISMNIVAERSETSDLMRRHIETLSAEFKDLGYSSISFSFNGERNSENLAGGTTQSPEEDDVSNLELDLPQLRHPDSGLDLRL